MFEGRGKVHQDEPVSLVVARLPARPHQQLVRNCPAAQESRVPRPLLRLDEVVQPGQGLPAVPFEHRLLRGSQGENKNLYVYTSVYFVK